MKMTGTYRIYPLGETAVTIELGNRIDEHTNQQVLSLFHHIKNKKIPGVTDIIPAYSSLTIVYDVIGIRQQCHPSAYSFIKQELEAALQNCNWHSSTKTRLIEVPVCYDVSLGIDLQEMSEQKQISINEIIQLHYSKTYRVFMIGFLPGFAYMGTVDKKITTPRKQHPRVKVLAGSVGIAGEQTGIYPFDSPGGWNIIGQTPVQMFNAKREEPVLLQAGDEVKFIPITLYKFDKLKI